jgi:glycine C-acetyltransferase
MEDLERHLAAVEPGKSKLVVVDAVFSMDGDIINLPEVSRLCDKYGAMLMVDEAHSLGVLGETGRGIEEHFGLDDVVDVKMGTLSKTIPSVGGYIAGSEDLITYLKHASRAFIFSASLPPAAVAAAKAAFEVIEEEPERVKALHHNIELLLGGLKERGFDTLNSETAIIPVVTKEDDKAMFMTKLAQDEDIFVLPIIPPAVPVGTSRLRVTVTSVHSEEEIEYALDVFERAGRATGVI